jgi:hypothetical protein
MRLIAPVVSLTLLAACSPARRGEVAAPPADGVSNPASAESHTIPPADVSGAEKLVRDLNAREAVPVGGADYDAFFAQDISAAMKADGSPDEVGAIGFDYRWNAQDFDITEVSYQAEPVNTNRAMVKVGFRNFGEARQTYYDLCKRPDSSWRILDVRSNDKPDGSVRAMLKLRPSSEATAC